MEKTILLGKQVSLRIESQFRDPLWTCQYNLVITCDLGEYTPSQSPYLWNCGNDSAFSRLFRGVSEILLRQELGRIWFYCNLRTSPATVSQMLVEDVRLRGQRQRILGLTAKAVARVMAFSYAVFQAQFPQSETKTPAHTWCAPSRRTLSSGSLHLLGWAVASSVVISEGDIMVSVLDSKHRCSLLWRETTYPCSKAVCWTKILKKNYLERKQSVPLLPRHVATWESQGDLTPNL